MNTLEDLAQGKADRNDVIESLMDFVRSQARVFLNINRTNGHLKDDLVSEGYLALTNVCEMIRETRDVGIANMNYVAKCVWNSFIMCVRNEQTIKPPKSHYEYLKRHTLEDDMLVDLNHESLEQIIDDMALDDFESHVLSGKLAGYSVSRIAKFLCTTNYRVNIALNRIKDQLDDQN